MMATRAVGAGRFQSLATRLAALLTLAILPLGIIAIVQTYRLIEESSAKTEAALFGEMLRAARSEREFIQASVGLAEGLARGIVDLSADDCTDVMRDLVERSEGDILAARIVDRSGIVACGSDGVGADLSQDPYVQRALANPRIYLRAQRDNETRGAPIISIGAPAYRGDDFVGYLVLIVPHDAIQGNVGEPGLRPLGLLTFTTDGEVLTSSRSVTSIEEVLPRNRSLRDLAGSISVVRDVDGAGAERIYTITPLVEGVVYVLAIWAPSLGNASIVQQALLTIFLPVAMWITSLGVAYFAVHRLVIRNVHMLRRRMRLFSRFRRVEEFPSDQTLPTELREVSESFVQMAHTIVRDEAELENSLHEKDVLLREVYHRVRNNLQLIASINNMQIRAASQPETRQALARLQDRIMALATIHQSLYQASTLSQIRADLLIAELASQVTQKSLGGSVHVALDTEFEPVTLYPDQAVPLSLLLVEALSNAAKQVGATGDAQPRLRVSLKREGNEICLVVENSVREDMERGIDGLGTRLIDAFVVQLDGEKTTELDGVYRLTVRFPPIGFTNDTHAPHGQRVSEFA